MRRVRYRFIGGPSHGAEGEVEVAEGRELPRRVEVPRPSGGTALYNVLRGIDGDTIRAVYCGATT